MWLRADFLFTRRARIVLAVILVTVVIDILPVHPPDRILRRPPTYATCVAVRNPVFSPHPSTRESLEASGVSTSCSSLLSLIGRLQSE